MIRWPRFARSRAHRKLSTAERERALRRCIACLVEGDHETAESEIVELVRADSRDVDLYLVLGRLVHDAGDLGRAIRIHQNLLLRADLAPRQRVRALSALARDLRAGGFLRRAVASFEEVRERKPRDPEVWKALAEVYEELGDFDPAIAAFERWARLAGLPRDERRRRAARLWLAKAKAAHEAGRADEARRAVRKAISNAGDCAEARILEGRLLAERGRNKQALSSWQAAAGMSAETDARVYPLIASAYAALDRSRDFEKWLRDRIETDPADPGPRAALARSLIARGDRSEAIVELRKLLDASHDHEPARALLGRALLEEGRKDEAAAELDAWITAWERHASDAADARQGAADEGAGSGES